ncbi:MAG: ribosomal RNA small subunit methyltransferase A [Candidatus Omnitrophica bacterium]|nr:ribosomal RNA small subunit methyltransferase A [Candidatus Omnitrophota bacterium]
MLTASELKALLRTHGLRLTKRLGQHFLVDERVVRQIVEQCGLSSSETVIEIGPGLGALTEPLAERAGRVIAVEIDPRIAALLAERLASAPHVTVRCQDILEFPWRSVGDVTVVGAIPYHLTSSILSALSEARRAIRRVVLVVQEELAQRLLAAPGTKAYGRLSVMAQYAWDVSPRLFIPRNAFFPQPEVDSRCLLLRGRRRAPVAVASEPVFFEVVKAAFSHRRKTLVNCLTKGCVSAAMGGSGRAVRLGRSQVESLLRGLGLPLSVRGEALSLAQFAALANALTPRPYDKFLEAKFMVE